MSSGNVIVFSYRLSTHPPGPLRPKKRRHERRPVPLREVGTVVLRDLVPARCQDFSAICCLSTHLHLTGPACILTTHCPNMFSPSHQSLIPDIRILLFSFVFTGCYVLYAIFYDSYRFSHTTEPQDHCLQYYYSLPYLLIPYTTLSRYNLCMCL
jgi:hypothetical protein